ncbi:MAG: tetratricopeptide repeat protein [Candidatus Omnitrophica bacterium]|nr:tetratricopeptide repeat protein [Candidatus Omnitrophota bacterium]
MTPRVRSKQVFAIGKPLFFWFLLFLLILLSLECLLRLGGVVFLSVQERENRRSLMKQGDCRILCIGESTTALGGKYSYPRQLEEILNTYSRDIRFSVMNKGVPGVKTTYLVDQLENHIRQYRPDIVVVMMGINDYNPLQRYSPAGSQKKNHMVTSLRIYKLAGLFLNFLREHLGFEHVQKAEVDHNGVENETISKQIDRVFEEGEGTYERYIRKGEELLEERNYKEAQEFFQKAIELNPQEAKGYTFLAWALHLALNYDDAVKVIDTALSLDPDIRTYLYASHIYYFQALKRRYFREFDTVTMLLKKVEEVCQRAIAEYPTESMGYVKMADFYMRRKQFRKAHQVYAEALHNGAINERILGGMAMAKRSLHDTEGALQFYRKAQRWSRQRYDPVTRDNFLKIYDIVRSKDIQLVCVQYPTRSIEVIRRIFQGKPEIIFVDNEKIFLDAIKEQGYASLFSDAFAGGFGHCTKKGNYVLASNVARAIFEEYVHIKVPADLGRAFNPEE